MAESTMGVCWPRPPPAEVEEEAEEEVTEEEVAEEEAELEEEVEPPPRPVTPSAAASADGDAGVAGADEWMRKILPSGVCM